MCDLSSLSTTVPSSSIILEGRQTADISKTNTIYVGRIRGKIRNFALGVDCPFKVPEE